MNQQEGDFYLGANGVMDSLREQFLALPESRKKKDNSESENNFIMEE